MKQFIVFITLISLCFGGDKIANLLQSQIQQLPPEIQQQFFKKAYSWKNIPGKQLNRSMMDPSDILGEWAISDADADLWITVESDQTILDPMQINGMEPAEGGIGISGSAVDTMDYMIAAAASYYGYGEITMVQLSNNSLNMEDDYDDYGYYDDFPEDLELPMYMFMYMSLFGNEVAVFMLADTVDGEMVGNDYEIEDAAGYISIDTTSMRIDISTINISNDAGDSTYSISGSIVPGTMDLVADEPTLFPVLDNDFGPDPEEEIVMQFFEDGTGLDIASFIEYDYYYGYIEVTDTADFEWSATDDSITLIFFDEYEDYGYYYSEIDTSTFKYVILDDSMVISIEEDYCDIMDVEYYDECDEMIESMYGIEDLEEAIIEIWVELSYNGSLAIAGDIGLQPKEFILHQAYPNPFNPTTTLKYEIGSAGPVSINLFDVSGRKIRSLYNGIQIPGQHEVRWDAKDDRGRSMSSGVYLFNVNVGGKTQTAKTLLLK